MRIGIDFDGTITENPAFFSRFTRTLKHTDVVYIISSCDKRSESALSKTTEQKKRKLKKWNVSYNKLLFALEPIPSNKARMCREHRIDVMIDDDIRNLKKIKKDCRTTACLQYMNKR
ncbi:MAG: hypothetical protein ACYCO0_04425 [Candidatus Micrarchaeaceae archaeon]